MELEDAEDERGRSKGTDRDVAADGYPCESSGLAAGSGNSHRQVYPSADAAAAARKASDFMAPKAV